MLPWEFALRNAFVHVSGKDRIRCNADAREEVEAARTRGSEDEPHY
jgi:hypothetical protein